MGVKVYKQQVIVNKTNFFRNLDVTVLLETIVITQSSHLKYQLVKLPLYLSHYFLIDSNFWQLFFSAVEL